MTALAGLALAIINAAIWYWCGRQDGKAQGRAQLHKEFARCAADHPGVQIAGTLQGLVSKHRFARKVSGCTADQLHVSTTITLEGATWRLTLHELEGEAA